MCLDIFNLHFLIGVETPSLCSILCWIFAHWWALADLEENDWVQLTTVNEYHYETLYRNEENMNITSNYLLPAQDGTTKHVNRLATP